MSGGASASTPAELPAVALLERRVGEAAAALALWRRRALAAEAEAGRLLATLDEAAGAETATDGEAAVAVDPGSELRRLRAENAALRSRLTHAHRRVGLLLDWLGALEGES